MDDLTIAQQFTQVRGDFDLAGCGRAAWMRS